MSNYLVVAFSISSSGTSFGGRYYFLTHTRHSHLSAQQFAYSQLSVSTTAAVVRHASPVSLSARFFNHSISCSNSIVSVSSRSSLDWKRWWSASFTSHSSESGVERCDQWSLLPREVLRRETATGWCGGTNISCREPVDDDAPEDEDVVTSESSGSTSHECGSYWWRNSSCSHSRSSDEPAGDALLRSPMCLPCMSRSWASRHCSGMMSPSQSLLSGWWADAWVVFGVGPNRV